MSDVEFLRGKLERLNAEKRCWQLVKEILTFLAKVKRECEKSEKSEKFKKSEKLEKLAFEKCEKFGFKKLRKLKVGERLAPVGNSSSSRNSPTGAMQHVSPLGVRDSKPRDNCRVAGEKSELNRFLSSPQGSQPAKTKVKAE